MSYWKNGRFGAGNRRTILGVCLVLCLALITMIPLASTAAVAESCPNADLRQGYSSGLPDCRAYERVTPADTNGVLIQAFYGTSDAGRFPYEPVAPDGASLSFETVLGSLPGLPAAGGNQQSYEAVRHEGAWGVSNVSPNYAQAHKAAPGPFPGNRQYELWRVFDGSADFNPTEEPPFNGSSVIRDASGLFTPLGVGSLGTEPNAFAVLASPDGGHLVFRAGTVRSGFLVPAVQLEPQAAEAPTFALYDRTADGITHVVSLLPGDERPEAGENAYFAGGSKDGTTLLFCLNVDASGEMPHCEGTTLYARVDGSHTEVITAGEWTAEGVSSEGRYAFFLEGGNLFSFDTIDESTLPITTSADVKPVNISANGSHVYFISPSLLDGAKGEAGGNNLYVWDRENESVRFIATLSEADVSEETSLVQWARAAGPNGEVVRDPSRTTPDGSVLAFESSAKLTAYANEGQTEVYLYNADTGTLSCPSCPAVGSPPEGSAHLQNDSRDLLIIFDSSVVLHSLSDDGRRLYFETPASLVSGDVDASQDVYQWEAQGTGTCGAQGGCVDLISSGHSLHAQNPPLFGGVERPTNFFFGATPNGHDVFILTRDALLPGARAGDFSIYDAREGGGFPQPEGVSCEGEGCQGAPSPAPSRAAVASSTFNGRGNVHRCRKHRRCKRRRHHRHRHRQHESSHRAGYRVATGDVK